MNKTKNIFFCYIFRIIQFQYSLKIDLKLIKTRI